MACNRPEIPESEIIEVVRIEGGIALMGEVGSALGGPLVDGPRGSEASPGCCSGDDHQLLDGTGDTVPIQGIRVLVPEKKPETPTKPHHPILALGTVA